MDPVCFGVLCWSFCLQSICSLYECVTVSTLSFCRFIREEQQQAMLGNQYLRPETWNRLCLYCLEMCVCVCVCLLTLWCHFSNCPIRFCCDQIDSNIMLIKHWLSFITLDVQQGDGSPPNCISGVRTVAHLSLSDRTEEYFKLCLFLTCLAVDHLHRDLFCVFW